MTSYLIEPELKYAATTSLTSLVNDTKHSINILPSSGAPEFRGKHSESSMQFLIRVQEYAESVHAWDRRILLKNITQFLRESALEWYCQLRTSHRRPQTWEEFTELFLTQFNSPIRRARQEQEWDECKQKEDETISEFIVRLRALWKEEKPNETEIDLVKHLLCRMRNDLFNMIRISRNALLDEIIAEVQQIEEILYFRAKNERLSNQLKQLSLQNVGTLPKKRYDEEYSHKKTQELSNGYSLNIDSRELEDYRLNVATSSRYLNNRIQRTIDTNTSQQLNSYGGYSCAENRHVTKNCPRQNGDYWQRRSELNPKNLQRKFGPKNQKRFDVNNSVKSSAELQSLETSQHINMNTRCLFCNISCTGYCCLQCHEMNRSLKFKRLLQLLDRCSESVMYYDEINSVVRRTQQVSLLKLNYN
jgi:hypothetical protein